VIADLKAVGVLKGLPDFKPFMTSIVCTIEI
jgi:hypothetical protein